MVKAIELRGAGPAVANRRDRTIQRTYARDRNLVGWFWRKANEIARGHNKFCSRACANSTNKGGKRAA